MWSTIYSGDFDIGSENLRRQGRTSDLRPDAQEIADDSGPLDTESIEYSEPDNNASDPVALHTLAGIYILAEKYQLPELLALCLRKMSLCINLTADPTGFLDLALVIYKGTPDSDTVFRPYFREHCSAVLIELGKLEDEGEQTVNEYINEGGTFAKDIHSASWRLHRLQRDLEPDSRDIWFQSNDATEMARLTEIIESHVDFWRRKCQRLLMEHATYHPRCKSGLDDSSKHLLLH